MPSDAAKMAYNSEVFEQELIIRKEVIVLNNAMLEIMNIAAQVKKQGDIGAAHQRAKPWAQPLIASQAEKDTIARLTHMSTEWAKDVTRKNISELTDWDDTYNADMRQLLDLKQKAIAAVTSQAKGNTAQKRDKLFDGIKKRLELALVQATTKRV